MKRFISKFSDLKNFWMIIMFIAYLCINPLSAQSLFDEALKEDQSSAVALNYELAGYLRGGMYVGPIPEAAGYQTKDRYGEAALKLRMRKDQMGSAYGELRFRNTNPAAGSTTAFTLREAYVNAYFGAVEVRIGQQVVQWGKADGYNPTNVITPMDLLIFSPNEDDRRIGNFLIRAYYNRSDWRLEVIWIPVYAPSVLPFTKVNLPEGIRLGTADYPDENLKHSAIALKAHYDGAAVDGTLSYFDGYMPMPGPAVHSAGRYLSVYPTAYRMHMVGADFSTTLGSYGLRGEFAYRAPEENENIWQSVPKRQIETILGIDREYGSFSLIVQYLGKHVFDFEMLNPLAPGTPGFFKYKIALWNRLLSGQSEEWSNAISFRPALNLCHETLSLELLGQVNFSTEELFLKPKLSYRLADDLTLTAGAQVFHGPDDTLFGLLDENNSAGFVEIKASF